MPDELADFALSISGLLRPDEPIERIPHETAAVAVIAREGREGTELLLIRRAEREGDPWSGQIAFPGGRVEQGDLSFMVTALRESSEEVGLDLKTAQFVGYLGPFQGRTRSVWVVPCIFLLYEEQVVVKNREVSSVMWIPVTDLLSAQARTKYKPEWAGQERSFPAFQLGDYLIWGLTERILTELAEAVSRSKG